MTLPKVLIIGQPFNNDTGGGVTLSNLFTGWDRNRIAVACSGYLLSDNIDPSICNIYYQLGNKEHKWSFPFNIIKRKYPSGQIKFSENIPQDLIAAKSKFRVKVIMDYFYPFLEYIGLYNAISKIELSKEFCGWLDSYKPDIIYAQTAELQGILLCQDIYDYLNKPLIFHMMDDWPSTISDRGLFKKYWFTKIDKEFRKLLDKASVLMSICDDMSYEYKARYNKDFIPFHNTIDIEAWKKYQRTNYELSDSPTILYAGRIGLGIESSLKLVAKTVKLLNRELDINLKFVMQTPVKPPWIDDYDCVVYNNLVPYKELPKKFSEADFLLLPYDFSRRSIRYIRLSMPTKAPEYMISGTPVILIAPDITAIVKYAKRENWAKVITSSSIDNVYKSIKQMIESEELRGQIAQCAINTAEKNHNSINVTRQFQDVIFSLVK